jgi:hypothetical protein
MKIKIQGYIELDKAQTITFLDNMPNEWLVKIEKVWLPKKSLKELRK